jgi:hypothetical protein
MKRMLRGLRLFEIFDRIQQARANRMEVILPWNPYR